MAGINEILIFLVGGIIGFVICRFTLGTKQKAAQQKELESSKAEMEQYKAQVTNHFNDSAKLMGEVASSYQALYKHMAGQSQTLLSDSDIEIQPFPQLKTASEKKPEEAQATNEAAQKTTQEAPQEDVAEETSETMLKNDAEESSEETAKKESKEETDKATAQQESEETNEAEPKKEATAPSQTEK